MLLPLSISLALVAATILIHYETLRQTSLRLSDVETSPRARILVVLVVALISHCLHILLYAAVFYGIDHGGGLGGINGVAALTFRDAFYFSITSYTTLGIGDLSPSGALRIISGIEALNGLVMVGWTTSFTYLTMEKFWHIAPGDDLADARPGGAGNPG